MHRVRVCHGKISSFLSVSILVLSLWVIGCDHERNDARQNSNMQSRLSSSCQFHCVSKSAFFLGASSIPVDNFFSVFHKHAEAVGLTYVSISPEIFLGKIDQWKGTPAILVHRNGCLYTCIGVVDWDGIRYYQLLHGSLGPSAVKEEYIAKDFVEVFFSSDEQPSHFPVPVGKGSVVLDSFFHNIGDMSAGTERKTPFCIKNEGESTIILGKPLSSCGCVVASLGQNVNGAVLQPRESIVLDVSVLPQKNPAMNHHVRLQLVEKKTGASSYIDLYLFGNSRKSMEVNPSKLDFGHISYEKRSVINRTIRISEVETDRFVVKNIDLKGLPINATIEETSGSGDLKNYRISLALDPTDLKSGQYEQHIEILSDSWGNPVVPVAVKFEIASSFNVTPRTLSFGQIKTGESVRRSVKITPNGEGPCVARVLDGPPECQWDGFDMSSPLELFVTVRLDQPKMWQNKFRIQIIQGDLEEIFELRCIALVSGDDSSE